MTGRQPEYRVRIGRYWRELAAGNRHGVPDRFMTALLVPPALLYGMILRVRAWGYSAGLFTSRRLGRPVISVGNISVGGTGKTPMTAHIARYLIGQGKRVAVLSRGYGGTSRGEARIVSDGTMFFLSAHEAGDEPYLLAKELPGLMVLIGHDRYEAGKVAERDLNPDCFILDDGFQHLRLRRDLDILLLDGRNPFGNGMTLPAGLLREPKSAIGRADLIVLTRCAAEGALPNGVDSGAPTLRAGHRLVGVSPLGGGVRQPFSALHGERVLAFAGIADPSGFFEALSGEGVDLVATRPFPDHAGYGEAAIEELCRLRDDVGATCLVTTAKDAVKLESFMGRLGPVMVAGLELELYDRTVLEQALRPFF